MNADQLNEELNDISNQIQEIMAEGFATWPTQEVMAGYFSLLIGLAVYKAIAIGADKEHFMNGVSKTWDRTEQEMSNEQ